MAEALSRAQRRRLDRVQPSVDKVTEADARFFERFPNRSYRARLAASAEIEQNAVMAGVEAMPPEAGARWIVLVKQLAPGVRLSAFAEAFDWSDLDVGEAEARDLYESRVRPGTYLHLVEERMLASLAGSART